MARVTQKSLVSSARESRIWEERKGGKKKFPRLVRRPSAKDRKPKIEKKITTIRFFNCVASTFFDFILPHLIASIFKITLIQIYALETVPLNSVLFEKRNHLNILPKRKTRTTNIRLLKKTNVLQLLWCATNFPLNEKYLWRFSCLSKKKKEKIPFQNKEAIWG